MLDDELEDELELDERPLDELLELEELLFEELDEELEDDLPELDELLEELEAVSSGPEQPLARRVINRLKRIGLFMNRSRKYTAVSFEVQANRKSLLEYTDLIKQEIELVRIV